LEVVIKIEVKDNNVEQALRVLKRKLQRDGFFKIIKLKNNLEVGGSNPSPATNYNLNLDFLVSTRKPFTVSVVSLS
jgi:hypothetical protein